MLAVFRRNMLRRSALGPKRWCSGGEKKDNGEEKRKLQEMSDDELHAEQKKLTWWPYLLVGGFLTFVWIPEYTKFVWHLKIQMMVHEIYWKLVLPKEEAASVIREAKIGIPAARRTSQNPLAACPLKDSEDPEQALKENPLPPGHPNPFAAGIVQVTEDLKSIKPMDDK
eukprot:TRINITY_DN28104_c0_g1_i1.p1 TRINITY_DN28104_c0_g1~~TRINITY_DN28104_c0_g1_i1.p1  ORF type:complete len:169 (+),score=35.02 TRINITY_DN28104_c0_g1_i1:57-563(+)